MNERHNYKKTVSLIYFVLFRLEEKNAHLRLVYQELQKQLNDLREERAGLQLLLDTVHKSSPPSY